LELPGGRSGAVVANVAQASAAARAGVAPGDVIVEVHRKPVGSAADAVAALRSAAESDMVFVLIWREAQEVFINVAGHEQGLPRPRRWCILSLHR
jgi:serine protease Do